LKLLIHQSALSRVDERLRRVGVPLDLILVGEDGIAREGGQEISNTDIRPEAIWLSLDAWEKKHMGPFMTAALSAPGLKWVQTFNAGMDSPIFRQIFDRGVRMSASSAQAVAIAEFAMAHVIAEWHPFAVYREAQRAHEWKRIRFDEISQSHWLVIGYGNIGREIARRAHGFGAKVTGVRRSTAPDEFAERMVTQAEVTAILPSADVVVLACPLNDATRDMANAAFFGAMKPNSVLVNVGRGGLVDETALVAGLATDKPRLAILDVFREEPLPADNPLWDHPKVRVSAHASSFGSGTITRGDQLFLDNLARYLKGGALINEVSESSF
jgi:phosphoglycerate dehydrogenase-like enzyme